MTSWLVTPFIINTCTAYNYLLVLQQFEAAVSGVAHRLITTGALLPVAATVSGARRTAHIAGRYAFGHIAEAPNIV